MNDGKLIRASDARKAILKINPKSAYCIDSVPAVDAAPVVHGRWLSEMHGNSNNGTCSVCGSHEHAYAFGWKYCPNCGAKMDLEVKNYG
jgi:hypothetical protein